MHTPISTLKTAAREPESTTVIDLVRRCSTCSDKRRRDGEANAWAVEAARRAKTDGMRLRIGSRGSQLALWQAHHISALLRERGHAVELEIIQDHRRQDYRRRAGQSRHQGHVHEGN